MTAKTTRRGPGRPRKTEEAKAADRASLLASARRTLAEHGPDVSLDEIAAGAGVSKPVIYAHFADKAGLAEALAFAVAAEIEEATAAKIAEGGADSQRELLRLGVDAFTKFMVEQTNLYRFIVRSMKATEADVMDNALIPAFQSRTAALVGLIYPGMDDDALEVASYALFGEVFAACEGWLQHRRFSRERLVDALVTLFVGGVGKLSGVDAPPS